MDPIAHLFTWQPYHPLFAGGCSDVKVQGSVSPVRCSMWLQGLLLSPA